MNSDQLCNKARISYRQLNYWTTKGWLHPVDGRQGTGNPADYPIKEADVAALMGRLTGAGMSAGRAAALARELYDKGSVTVNGVEITVGVMRTVGTVPA